MTQHEVLDVQVQPERHEALPSVRPKPSTGDEVMRILEMALEKGVSGDELAKIITLGERMADRKALSDYSTALVQFQSECPPLPESKKVSVDKNGVKLYGYTYAPLERILQVIRPFLMKHGLSVSWDSDLIDEKSTVTDRQTGQPFEQLRHKVKVVCKVRHISGHVETATFTAAVDGQAKMSEVQASASALTYGRRQSLIQALGLESDPDTDAAPPEARIHPDTSSEPPISDDMLVDLENRCQELGRTPDQFAVYLRDVARIGGGKLKDLRQGQYDQAVRVLQDIHAKRAKGVK